MPAFAFTARRFAPGPARIERGLRVVASEGALAPALAAEGLFLLRAEPAGPARPAPGQVRHARGELPLLLLHLATYLEAGLPLLAALQDFRDPERPRLEAAVLAMAQRLGEGSPLSAIMAGQPGLFEPVHVAMVRAGEATGRLDQALRALLRLADWHRDFRAQARRAAAYPLLLLAVITAVILLVCTYSLPNILLLLEGLGIPLPFVTRAFLALGHGLLRYGWLAVALPLVLCAALRLALRRPAFRLAWDGALLRTPVVGRLVTRMALARFAHFFAAQYAAGIPLVQALRASEGVTGNARLGESVRRLRLGVEQGGGLAATAARVGPFPPLVLRMLAIGEETGKLEETLERAAAHFDAEVEEGVRLCFQVLDPVLKGVMAALLVFVATAVLLPLYTLIGGLNG